MEIFFAQIDGSIALLDAEESAHCVRVLRHKPGDTIHVIDGSGALYTCEVSLADPRGAEARVVSVQQDWGSHPYFLNLAVCPTKNIDRYEWMVEKATEIGVDVISPVIGDRSERKVLKTDRLRRLILSATKQSLKGRVPVLQEPTSVRDFIASSEGGVKLICYCSDDVQPRGSIMEVLCTVIPESTSVIPDYVRGSRRIPTTGSETPEQVGGDEKDVEGEPCERRQDLVFEAPPSKINPAERQAQNAVCVLVGPEGDFSPEEVRLALDHGFIPVHLGASRLRTETAGVVATTAVYLTYTK